MHRRWEGDVMRRWFAWQDDFYRTLALLPLLLFFINYRDYFFKANCTMTVQYLLGTAVFMIYYGYRKKPKAARTLLVLVLAASLVWFAAGIVEKRAQVQSWTVFETESEVDDAAQQVVRPTEALFTQQLKPVTDYFYWLYHYKLGRGADVQVATSARVDDALNAVTDVTISVSMLKWYEGVFSVMMSALTLAALCNILKFKPFRVLLLLPLLHFLWLWYAYVDIPLLLFQRYVISMLCYIGSAQMTVLTLESPDYETTHYRHREMLTWSLGMGLLILAIAGLLMIVLPIKQINAAVDPLLPNLWGTRSAFTGGQFKMFTLDDTAFQGDDKRLGGPIQAIDRDTVLFQVTFDSIPAAPIYLRANVKDYYSGINWESRANTYASNFEAYFSNTANRLAVKAIEADTEKISGTIQFEAMNSLTLFAPLGLFATDLDPSRVYASHDNEAFFKAGAFVKMLDAYHFDATGRDYSFFDEIDYRQLPQGIDADVYALAASLTAGETTDLERVTALTRYLVSNYPYTLTPVPFNGDDDFVSTFLLSTREGYCTYFASALAVMTRMNAIPARYVEGFRVDPDGGTVYDVTEGEAHAWVEIYLHERGWTVWEATPPYSVLPAAAGEGAAIEGKADVGRSDDAFNQGNATAGVLNLKEAMLEAEMTMGIDAGETAAAPEEADENHTDLKEAPRWYFIILPAMGMVALFVTILRNLLVCVGKRTRAKVIQKIAYLDCLISETSDDSFFSSADKRQTVMTPEAHACFEQLKYDRPDRITPALVLSADIFVMQLIKVQYRRYRERFGIVRFVIFRGFRARKYFG
jgi:transglutaminase-like putative cysteine protease